MSALFWPPYVENTDREWSTVGCEATTLGTKNSKKIYHSK